MRIGSITNNPELEDVTIVMMGEFFFQNFAHNAAVLGKNLFEWTSFF